MTHLTTKQILQFVDGTLDYASQAQCTSHLAVCERCRHEVGFQKAVAKVSRHQALVPVSSRFTQNLMAQVVPEMRTSWKTKFVDNLGNVFAMCLVLIILGYAVSTPSIFQVTDQAAQPSLIPPVVSDTYAKIVQSFSQRASDASKQVVTSSGNESTKTIGLAVISLLILAALDQFVLKRHLGIRTRH